MELIQRWHTILRSITKEDTVALMFDKDPDGISSGVILASTIERQAKKIQLLFPQYDRNNAVNDKFVENLRKENVTVFLSVDSSLEKYEEQLTKISKFARVIIFDHHKIYSEPNNDNITIIKSQYIRPELDPSQYCTAKLVYDCCKDAANITDLDWKACIGILADSNYKTHKEFVHQTYQKYNWQIEKEIFTTAIGKVASLIGYADSAHADLVAVFNIVYTAKSPDDIIPELDKFEDVSQELHTLMNEHRLNIEQIGDLIIYEIKPKYMIGSTLSTILSHRQYPDKTLIIISEHDDGKLHISARRQDQKIQMNTLLEKSIVGCDNANAGGHIPASGATIEKKDRELFLKQLKSLA